MYIFNDFHVLKYSKRAQLENVCKTRMTKKNARQISHTDNLCMI